MALIFIRKVIPGPEPQIILITLANDPAFSDN